jgi:hypothetical protein
LGSYVQSGFSAFGSTLTSGPTPGSEGSCCGGGDEAIGGGNVATDVAAADTLVEADDEDELDFLLWYIPEATINPLHSFVCRVPALQISPSIYTWKKPQQ